VKTDKFSAQPTSPFPLLSTPAQPVPTTCTSSAAAAAAAAAALAPAHSTPSTTSTPSKPSPRTCTSPDPLHEVLHILHKVPHATAACPPCPAKASRHADIRLVQISLHVSVRRIIPVGRMRIHLHSYAARRTNVRRR